jgi:hypothetical protein
LKRAGQAKNESVREAVFTPRAQFFHKVKGRAIPREIADLTGKFRSFLTGIAVRVATGDKST